MGPRKERGRIRPPGRAQSGKVLRVVSGTAPTEKEQQRPPSDFGRRRVVVELLPQPERVVGHKSIPLRGSGTGAVRRGDHEIEGLVRLPDRPDQKAQPLGDRAQLQVAGLSRRVPLNHESVNACRLCQKDLVLDVVLVLLGLHANRGVHGTGNLVASVAPNQVAIGNAPFHARLACECVPVSSPQIQSVAVGPGDVVRHVVCQNQLSSRIIDARRKALPEEEAG